jgi:excisionase family DNA binding protein
MDNDQTEQQHNEVMNGDEAAVFLRMPKSTLLKLCSEDQLPGVKVGRQWRFHRDALENWRREKAGEAATLSDDNQAVAPAEEAKFTANLDQAESRLKKEIKPVVEEIVGSVGDEDFESVGEIQDLDEMSGVGEVTELPETNQEPPAKATRKTPPRATSAIDLMAQISEKSQGRKPTKAPRGRSGAPMRATKDESDAPTSARNYAEEPVRESFRDSSSGNDAVEISRPYNKPGSGLRPEPQRPQRRTGGGAFEFVRKLSYWVVVLAVLTLAGLQVKTLLVPVTMDLPPAPVTKQGEPTAPPLPEFKTVYIHNTPDEPGQDTFKAPAQPTPLQVAEATPTPLAPSQAAPTPAVVAAAEVVPQGVMPISSQQPVDKGMESINRLLPALYDLSGCTITSNNNEIRITFQSGIFASGVKIDGEGRKRLARVAEFLTANAGDFWVIIEGQTDGTKVRTQSPFRDNYTLGLRRAVAATEVMREDAGFPQERLLASSAGGMAPPFAGNLPDAAARNRTVVLRLIPKSGGIPTAAPQ